jgi:hypothetical protein
LALLKKGPTFDVNVETAKSKNVKSLWDQLRVTRRHLADLVHPRLYRSALQPRPKFLDRGRAALRDDFDGTVR